MAKQPRTTRSSTSRSRPSSRPPSGTSTRSRSARSTTPRGKSPSGGGLPAPKLPAGPSPDVVRSLVGLFLLALGAVTLIALLLPGEGSLTDWWLSISGPFFGTGRWLLPFVLLLAGWYVEWGPGKEPGAPWGRTLLGIGMAYIGFIGLLSLMALSSPVNGEPTGGGRIGRLLSDVLQPLLTAPGAFVILVALVIAGLLIAFDLSLRSLVSPATRAARAAGSTLQDRTTRSDDTDVQVPAATAPKGATAAAATAGSVADKEPGRRGRAVRVSTADAEGQVGLFGEDDPERFRVRPNEPELPAGKPVAGQPQVPSAAAAAALAEGTPGTEDGEADGDQSSVLVPPAPREVAWVLPSLDLLDVATDAVIAAGDVQAHQANMNKIVNKLKQLGIEVTRAERYTAGPSFTQYEVEPAPHVKLSRIAAVEDDLAMALEAPSIRIEAPIPGKSAVGIEVPNRERRRVFLRPVIESRLGDYKSSPLAFALGMDGQLARTVDLAKTPHLLIAGATGSGKSVMVNALIMSLLCNATPDDLRLVLVDPKRVELSGYNGLPHLLVPVITETDKAKAVLNWAVNEMEHRYRRFAGATARNIAAFNVSRADPADRMPYIVIIIDELADLMMREGKNVEDPIVRLAQKARATGIHMVLATQRPSVNVVTGLIKANFPSRIAFAMASQIDSRTILDQPGAELLTGMGDMLYQPPDKPSPFRLQGVFVGDDEITRVTDAWRAQRPEPHYDMSILATGDDSTGNIADLPEEEVDKLLPEAINAIREYDRASASLLQRRLKVGYARAARMIDQLEAKGYVGSFDGSNARKVLLGRDDGPGPGDDIEDEA